jgi:hypothetical protein
MVAGIDDFYKDPANVAIPISTALQDVAAKFNGRPQREIEGLVESQRKWAR